MTGVELAKRSRISPPHLSRIEAGLAVPSLASLERIANALGRDIKSFFGIIEVDEEFAKAVAATNLSSMSLEQLLSLDSDTKRDLLTIINRVRELEARERERDQGTRSLIQRARS